MRDGQVAARRDGVHHRGHDRVRVVGAGHDVEHREQGDRDRAGEVKQPCGLPEDGVSVAQVRVDVLGGPGRAAGQQGAGVGQDDGVVVHVDDPGLRGDGLGDLVGVARRGYAGADVEELADAGLGGEVADHPAEERPVRPRGEGHLR